MNINTSLGIHSALSVNTLIEMRNQLSDLQRQLGTGKKADSYAGLGLDRGLTIGLRSHLSTMSGFAQTISEVDIRLKLAGEALTQLDTINRSAKSTVMQSNFALTGGTQTTDQRTASVQFDQLLSVLNTSTGGRYIFSGRSVDQPPVADSDVILNGQGSRAGLKQVIDERYQADIGLSGLGRLNINALSPTEVQLEEDVAGSPFGFKVAGITTTIPGAVIAGPAGSPPAASIDIGAVNPFAGNTIRFTLNLPDGSTRDLTLTATNAVPAGPNEFSIGVTAADTATNLQGALGAALTTFASTELAAASAVAASNDFFNFDSSNPPQRVDGPPFGSATALIDATPDNTVSWYTGDAGADSARATAVARVDQSLALSYGMRANEEGLRMAVQSIAVFAAMSFSASDPDAEARYIALKQRVTGALDGLPGKQTINDIQADVASVHTALDAAKDRHQQTQSTLQELLQQAEGVSTEEVAAKLLTLQTNLQATLQTTALLLRTNLLQYL
jgi:flagellar hook-associated protein 3 FlgL